MKTVLTTIIFSSSLSLVSMAQNTDVDINMNMGGMGVDMNVNISETQTTTTTTTTTSTTTSGGHDHTDVYVMPGYSGETGCSWPMDDGQFAGVKNSISSKDWDETRLTIAKQVIKANCITSGQVSEIVGLMEWEAAKLEIAKFAYGYTYDIGNYYKINDAFEWEASITELNEYIDNYRW